MTVENHCTNLLKKRSISTHFPNAPPIRLSSHYKFYDPQKMIHFNIHFQYTFYRLFTFFHSNLFKKQIHFNIHSQHTFYRLSTSFPLYLLYEKIVSSSPKPKCSHCYESLFNVPVNKSEPPLLLERFLNFSYHIELHK